MHSSQPQALVAQSSGALKEPLEDEEEEKRRFLEDLYASLRWRHGSVGLYDPRSKVSETQDGRGPVENERDISPQNDVHQQSLNQHRESDDCDVFCAEMSPSGIALDAFAPSAPSSHMCEPCAGPNNASEALTLQTEVKGSKQESRKPPERLVNASLAALPASFSTKAKYHNYTAKCKTPARHGNGNCETAHHTLTPALKDQEEPQRTTLGQGGLSSSCAALSGCAAARPLPLAQNKANLDDESDLDQDDEPVQDLGVFPWPGEIPRFLPGTLALPTWA